MDNAQRLLHRSISGLAHSMPLTLALEPDAAGAVFPEQIRQATL